MLSINPAVLPATVPTTAAGDQPTGERQRPGASGKGDAQREITLQEQRQLASLQQRDRAVRAHEAAHLAAAGGLARGGASFSYQRGPDGARYAVGGEVSIDTSPVPGDPRATLQKAQTIRRAALAPVQPSGQDRAIAARAVAMAAEARAELTRDAAGRYRDDDTAGATESTGQRLDLYA